MAWGGSGSVRERLGLLLAFLTLGGLGAAFVLSKGTEFLMPGPLASAHGAIENCNACHTKSGTGKLSWAHGLTAGDPVADSKACLTCHKMPDTAFNAHGATTDVLKKSTERLVKIAATTPEPPSARAQNAAFPTDPVVAGGLACATCHQEHQGAGFNLSKISNEQCRSCHAVKFDSFDGNHPKFEGYPFKRRTRIVYDHAGHFGKHYPEVAKKDKAKRIPDTCADCHNSRGDRRIMAVAPFEQTCSACHLDQIVGKERASGPKGIAFLSLPGLDVETLKKKKAPLGEWPAASEAELTPFMKVILSRNEKGRALVKAVDKLNLQDLAAASDADIKAATDLAWEIKRLFHALIAGKASDVLAGIAPAGGAKLSPTLVADLTASIPRDVVIGAQQQWLPNLAREIANGPMASSQSAPVTRAEQPKSNAAKPNDAPEPDTASRAEGSTPAEKPSASAGNTDAAPAEQPKESEATVVNKRDPPPCLVRLFGQCLMPSGEAAKPLTGMMPEAMRAGLADVAQAAAPEAEKTGDQSDDLLFPTEDELRKMKQSGPPAGKAAESPASTPAASAPATPASSDAATGTDTAAETPQAAAAPALTIESDIDPESWAEYGGWYRQDYAIFYRPVGHKDKLVYSWLTLTGPMAPKGDTSPTAAVFNALTGKDAQGSCTKCHSVDDIPGKGRLVNFSPPSVETKQGRFTAFVHEPHFAITESRGCLTCHDLAKDASYLKSYEQGDPHSFSAGFGEIKKDQCQTCHMSGAARQDCLLCHDYHENGVVTPIMSTKLPTQK